MMRPARKTLGLVLMSLAFVSFGQAGNGLNDLLGIQLWGGKSLWEDVAADTANRLKFSDQANQSGNEGLGSGYFRANLDKARNQKVLGSRAYSLEIYSTNRKITRVVIGFVNRADLVSELEAEVNASKTNPSTGQFLADFEKRLAAEREAAYAGILARLSRQLGPPLEGTASNLRQWNWEQNLLTLENADLALTLRIEPVGSGREPVNPTSAQFKSQKLRSRSNGDVVLTGIPPISQGPRGFCVPASWEKCLRFHGMNLDVYQLGEKGGTDYYGTPFIPFAAKIAPLLEARHFRMQLLKRDTLGLEMIKRYIDQAAPLIWCMNAQRIYYWLERSKKRGSYLNDKADGLVKDPTEHYLPAGGHALLIIGYNAVLKEVALSDSTELGSGEPEIWIKEEDLLATALPDGLVAVLPEDSSLLNETKFLNPSMLKRSSAPSVSAPDGKKWY